MTHPHRSLARQGAADGCCARQDQDAGHLQARQPLCLLLPCRRQATLGVGPHSRRSPPRQNGPLTDIGRGEFEHRSRIGLHDYLRDWIGRYQGTGRREYREETRDEDRRLLERHALGYLPAQLKLELTPSMVAGFVGWLCDPKEQANNAHRIDIEQARAEGKHEPKPLPADAQRARSDSTVRLARYARR